MFLLLLACVKPLLSPEPPAEPSGASALQSPASQFPVSEACCQLYEKSDDDSDRAAPWPAGEGPGQRVDLDGDGVAEFIAQVPESCGTGGCDFEVLQSCSAPSHFRAIYTFGGWTLAEAGPEQSMGVRDLVADSALPSDQVGSTEPFLYAQQIGFHVWNGASYQPAKTERIHGPDGLLAQTLVLPSADEGCPHSRVQVPTEQGWRTEATVPGAVSVSVGAQGQWAGIVSCSEHTEGLLLGASFMPLSTPELPWSLSWMPPGEQGQARVAFVGQDIGQPVQMVVFEEGAAGWGPGPDLCEPSALEDGRVSWQGSQLDLVEERDLNEDGVAERIAQAPAVDGETQVHVLGACNSEGSRFRSLGVLSSHGETTVETGTITEKHFELRTTDADGAPQRWAWSGWRYALVE